MQAQGQRDSWIDFDTGRTYPHPVEVVRNGDEKDIIAWARLHGIDALAAYTISGLASHDMTAVRLDESDWNRLTPSQLAKAVSRRDAQIKPVKEEGFDFVKLTSIPGSTFGFKTREGGLGILQVVDFMKEPWRIKIRYKMTEDVRKIEYELQLVKSANNLKQMGLALAMFANDHNSKLPDTLQELEHYVGNEQDFQWILENVEYLGKGKKHIAGSFNVVTAYDKTLLEEGNGTNVLFGDGHVKFEVSGKLEELGITSKTEEATLESIRR
jgi:prepilin-type processing-associated H-X9-DG protein